MQHSACVYNTVWCVCTAHVYIKHCLKNEKECIVRFKKLSVSPQAFKPDNTRLQISLKGFKISDIDQLILRGGSKGRVQGVRTPPPPPLWDDLRFSKLSVPFIILKALSAFLEIVFHRFSLSGAGGEGWGYGFTERLVHVTQTSCSQLFIRNGLMCNLTKSLITNFRVRSCGRFTKPLIFFC